MKPRRSLPALALLGTLAALPAAAEPAFAVRTGYRCSQCHVNRTGGGLRTSFGSLYTQTVLPHRLLPLPEGRSLLPANPDARFALGGDARFQYLGVGRRDAAATSSFEIPEANLYGQVRLLPDRLGLYLDQKVGPESASARELFGLLSFGSRNGYVKFGKFLPAFGWRLPDDEAFIRRFTGFGYSAPDVGVEVGAEPGRWSLHVSAVNGAGGGGDDDRSKQFTLQAVRRFGPVRVGIQASNNIGGGVRTTVAGLHGGLAVGRLALLAEGDWFETSRVEGTTTRWVGFLEADVLIVRGLNLKIAHDWVDPDRDVSTDARVRDSIGVEYVPWPFLQIRWVVRDGDGPPQIPGVDDSQAEVEVHVFF